MPYLSREDRRQELVRFAEHSKDRKGCDVSHLLDLDLEFPNVDMFGPQSIGAWCGQGWATLVRAAVAAISVADGRIGQIKQKFGGLRVYWDPPEGLRRSDPLYEAVVRAVQEAEAASFGTCEHCGSSIAPPRSESYQTLCDGCMR
jgi:hypothetical protein